MNERNDYYHKLYVDGKLQMSDLQKKMNDKLTIGVLANLSKDTTIGFCKQRLDDLDKVKLDYSLSNREFFDKQTLPLVELRQYYKSILSLAEFTVEDCLLVSALDFIRLSTPVPSDMLERPKL